MDAAKDSAAQEGAAQAIVMRPARADDVERLADFQCSLAAETEDKRLDPETVRKGLVVLLEEPSRGRYFVAERDGVVVGSIMITLEWSDWRDGWFWWIQSVYTAQEARRSGVYSAMHAHVMGLAKADPKVTGVRLYVETDNLAAQRTYEALGMRRSSYVIYEDDFAFDG